MTGRPYRAVNSCPISERVVNDPSPGDEIKWLQTINYGDSRVREMDYLLKR